MVLHRAGRITASLSKLVYASKSEKLSKSTMDIVLQYASKVDVPATRYGTKMEKTARESYNSKMIAQHADFEVKETGLHISLDQPYLGASPDGLVNCSCHSNGLLEIKCPS